MKGLEQVMSLEPRDTRSLVKTADQFGIAVLPEGLSRTVADTGRPDDVGIGIEILGEYLILISAT